MKWTEFRLISSDGPVKCTESPLISVDGPVKLVESRNWCWWGGKEICLVNYILNELPTYENVS